ncbi:Small subunit processome component 20 like protein [Myotis davidii]|uniref:Small subunit processome component 20 like protein n=1 Tax=Myotis davidii TaxID=225400 RepID=L5LKU2_MYODS|nr:Small subunit processome component 20 like protein [Myotis davidii]
MSVKNFAGCRIHTKRWSKKNSTDLPTSRGLPVPGSREAAPAPSPPSAHVTLPGPSPFPTCRRPGAAVAREKEFGHLGIRERKCVNEFPLVPFCCIPPTSPRALVGRRRPAVMKPKPVSHKTENTHRFLTFAERLGNVNIDIIHRIDRTASYDEVSDKNSLFNLMFLDLDEHPEKVEGVGQLLFEMCKGVRNMFHSCTGKAVKLILQKLGPVTETETQLPWILVGEALKNMAKSTAFYIYKEHFGVFFECLQESLLDLHTKVTQTNCGESSEQIKRLLETYLILVKHGNGSKITKPIDVCKVLSQTLQIAHLSTSCRETLLDVISALILGENVALPETLIKETIEKTFESQFERRLILDFSEVMFPMKQFEQLFLPSFLLYIENCFLIDDTAVKDEALAILAKLILNKAAPPTAGSMAIERYPLVFSPQTVESYVRLRKTRSKGGKEQIPVLDHLLSIIQLPPNNDTTFLSCSWAALVVLPHIRPLEKEKVIPLVTCCIESLFMTVDRGSFGKGNLFVLCQAVNTLLSLEESSELLHLVPVERVKNLVLMFPLEPSVLLLADLYYQRLSLCGCKGPLSEEALMELFPKLQANISTGISKIRLLTIRILNHFEVRLPELMEDDGLSERQSAFAVLRQAELVPATVNDYREKLLHLRKLRHDVVQTAVPDGPLQEVPLRYLLGMLYVNFSALWDPVIELISSHAHEMENKKFWNVYYEHLEKAATHAEKELQNDIRDEEKFIGDESWEQTQDGDVGALYLEQLELKTNCQERLDHTNF